MSETIVHEIKSVAGGNEHFHRTKAGALGLAVLPVDEANKEAITKHVNELAIDGDHVTPASKILEKVSIRERG